MLKFETWYKGKTLLSVLRGLIFKKIYVLLVRTNETVSKIRVSIEWGFTVSKSLLLTKLPKSRKWPQIAIFSRENDALRVSTCSLSTAFALD